MTALADLGARRAARPARRELHRRPDAPDPPRALRRAARLRGRAAHRGARGRSHVRDVQRRTARRRAAARLTEPDPVAVLARLERQAPDRRSTAADSTPRSRSRRRRRIARCSCSARCTADDVVARRARAHRARARDRPRRCMRAPVPEADRAERAVAGVACRCRSRPSRSRARAAHRDAARRWIEELRDVALEIGGDDLIAAGIARGAGDRAAARADAERRLDGELAPGRERRARRRPGGALMLRIDVPRLDGGVQRSRRRRSARQRAHGGAGAACGRAGARRSTRSACRAVAVARQVHGAEIVILERRRAATPSASREGDGVATRARRASRRRCTSPTACRSRSAARAAWRCSTAAGAASPAGSSPPGVRALRDAAPRGALQAAIGPGRRRLLLRDRRGGPRALRRLPRRATAACSTSRRSPRRSCARPASTPSRTSALCTICDAPAGSTRTGATAPSTGRQGGFAWRR